MATANRTALVKRVQETKVLPGEWNNEAWISALANVCWPKATDQEVMVGAAFAGRYGLNPFVNEFHLIHGRPFVGRDGFLRIGTNDKRYVDHVFGKVYEKDSYSEENGVANHSVGGFGKATRGKFLGAYCTIWTEGPGGGDLQARTYPAEIADFNHYVRNPKKKNWQRDPEGMTLVRSITTAFRATFSLGALYTVEEAEDVIEGDVVVDAGPIIEASSEDKKEQIKRKLDEMKEKVQMPSDETPLSEEEDMAERLNVSNAIIDMAAEDEVDLAILYEVLCKTYNVPSSAELTLEHLKEVATDWDEVKKLVAEYVESLQRPRRSDNS